MPRTKKQAKTQPKAEPKPTKEELAQFVEEEGKRARAKRQKIEEQEKAKTATKKETPAEKQKRIAEECSSVFYGTYYTMFVSDVKTAVETLNKLSTLSKTPIEKLAKMVRLPFLTVYDQEQVAKKLKL